MVRERVYRAGQKVLVPLGGFVAGWLAYRVVEEKGLIGEENLRQIRLFNLSFQLYLQQHVLPDALSAKYCYPEDFLKTMIGRLKSSNGDEDSEKWTFEQVLRECNIPEQIAWLEEHASHEIPYFYIADIFNGWCNLHRELFFPVSVAKETGDGKLWKGGDNAFASEVLCKCVVEKMMNGVLPFDIAVRTLCILAVGHSTNVWQMSKLISPKLILDRYEAYLDSLKERGKPLGDVIPSVEVAAATLELLRALNVVSTRGWKLPFWGRASREHLVATQLDGERWCRCFGELPSDVVMGCASGTIAFAEALSQRFKCPNGGGKQLLLSEDG